MSGEQGLPAEVQALGAIIRDAIKRRTLPPLWPGGPGGMGASEYDIARDVLAAGYAAPAPERDRAAEVEAAEDRAEQAAYDAARERS